jgi:hypothetical protein
VQHHIWPGLAGIIEHTVEVFKKIRAAPAPLNTRPHREIKTQVSIGEENDARFCHLCSESQE